MITFFPSLHPRDPSKQKTHHISFSDAVLLYNLAKRAIAKTTFFKENYSAEKPVLIGPFTQLGKTQTRTTDLFTRFSNVN